MGFLSCKHLTGLRGSEALIGGKNLWAFGWSLLWGVFELVAEISSSSPSSNPLVYNKWSKEGCFFGSEPTSVLETIRSPSSPTSTSTLSSSLGGVGGGGGGGGGGSTDTAGVAAVSGNPSQKWPPLQQETSSSNAGVESGCGSLELHTVPPSLEIGSSGGTTTTGAEKCGMGMGMEDWEIVLSESVAASPSQEQSILRWIMGDEEDPSMGLNKLLQTGGFGFVDQGFALDPVAAMASGGGNLMATLNPLPTSGLPPATNKFNNEKIAAFNQPQPFECSDVKPQIFNSQVLINPLQAQHTQNSAFFLPFPHTQQEQHLLMPPQPKKHNPGGFEPNCPIPKAPFSDSGQEQFMGQQNQQPQGLSHQLQSLPHYLPQRPTMATKPKMLGDEMGQHHQQQAIIDLAIQGRRAGPNWEFSTRARDIGAAQSAALSNW
ncbi:hypothetical protein F0562_014744 [Nyssa sinensis]|uniref:Uncharacterized protein n=1 Tax=Nyssa sinensis TaxID=561372 RepID=A0A5J4ZRY8_9ASTE|nr:hypothetical protein F0562_014744 [Nyssa sinensis]